MYNNIKKLPPSRSISINGNFFIRFLHIFICLCISSTTKTTLSWVANLKFYLYLCIYTHILFALHANKLMPYFFSFLTQSACRRANWARKKYQIVQLKISFSLNRKKSLNLLFVWLLRIEVQWICKYVD